MRLKKGQITLLVCLTNKQKLNLFIKNNSQVLKNLFCLYVTDFTLSKHVIPFNNEILVLPNSSLSTKRNTALNRLQSKYIAITDDDCIFMDGWLEQVELMIKSNQKCVFGSVHPYNLEISQNKTCLIQIKKTKSYLIHKNNFFDHFEQIGFTNNCVISKDLLISIGGFKEWLGPGTFLQSGEDAEIILSILSQNHSILHNHKMIVAHNSWIKNESVSDSVWGYLLGGITAYYFHLFRGETYCFQYIKKQLIVILKQLSQNLISIFTHPRLMKRYSLRVLFDVFLLIFTPIFAIYFLLKQFMR